MVLAVGFIQPRSIHRPYDPDIPTIVTHWQQSSLKYTLRSWYLEKSALFQTYDPIFFEEHLLPNGPIQYRYQPDVTVSGATLDALLNKFIEELQSTFHKRKSFTDFVVIKDRDYNYKTHSGVIIIEFKKYPFVVKLFMETPATFVQPFSKGFEPSCLFVMGGGVNRYLSGFTRIKNLVAIKKRVDSDPYWKDQVDFPCKWFWKPQKIEYFTLTGYNFGPQRETLSIRLPSIYGIFCEKINYAKSFHLINKKQRERAIKFSEFLENRIDRNIGNFVLEKKRNSTEQFLMVLVDSEHFPTMVGIREKSSYCNSYISWYNQLMSKCFHNLFFRTKQERRNIQQHIIPPILTV